MPFANYGLAKRMTAALRQAGSSYKVSAIWCFLLTGWPFFGSGKRLKRGTQVLNDAGGVHQHATGLLAA